MTGHSTETLFSARPSAASSKVVRCLLACLAFLAMWCGSVTEAHAKSPMCSDSAETITAPPPLYAASDAAITACDEEESLSLHAIPLGERMPRLLSLMDAPQQQAVLSLSMTIPVALSLSKATVHAQKPQGIVQDEHRWRDIRPPSL